MKKNQDSQRPRRRGPAPERLIVGDDWEAAASKAIHAKPPPGGWLTPKRKKKRASRKASPRSKRDA
jgi:hypothetical protein